MSVTIRGSEQAITGGPVDNFQLELAAERITVKELIRSRVFQKVKDYNARELRRDDDPSGRHVPQDESELALNGQPKTASQRLADWQAEFARAVDSFQKNQILVTVDNRQLTDLDEVVHVKTSSEISFLRLTMLAGG